MNKVIVYTSKTGVTEDVAKMIQSGLSEPIDLHDIGADSVIDLSDYDAVVLGGAVYATRVSGKLRRFVRKNQRILDTKRVGVFLCGADAAPAIDQIMKASFPENMLHRAVFTEHCGGELRIERMGCFSRFIIRMVGKSKEKQGAIAPVCLNEEAIAKLIKAVDEL